jgi:hypothetical protein
VARLDRRRVTRVHAEGGDDPDVGEAAKLRTPAVASNNLTTRARAAISRIDGFVNRRVIAEEVWTAIAS